MTLPSKLRDYLLFSHIRAAAQAQFMANQPGDDASF